MAVASEPESGLCRAIVNATLVTARGCRPRGAIGWDAAGRIIAIGPDWQPAGPALDAEGALLCPGFINLHVHGAAGCDTLDATPAALAALAQHQAEQGVTGFVATAAAASHQQMLAAASAVGAYRAAPAGGAQLLGLHAEGPFLVPARVGAQNPAHLRPPDWSEVAAWQEASGGAVRLLTLAPELDPNGELVRRAVAAGTVVAAGHTDASYEQAQVALRTGLTHAAHLFNAMSRFDYRRPGVLEALLENERVSLEIIPDCTSVPHVHPVALRLLRRMVGVERLCTVTDAIAAEGMADGDYELAGRTVRVEQHVAFLREPWLRTGEKVLAGSVLAMNRAVANLVARVGLSLEEAVQTASLNPARVLGLDDRVGVLAPGRDADLVLLEPGTYKVLATWVKGELVSAGRRGRQ